MSIQAENSKNDGLLKNLQSISFANLITVSRLIITPVLIYTILNDYYVISGLLVCFAILSDWLDGIIARKTNDVTKHGELLDPAVDKIFTISVLIAFVEKHLISTFIVFLIILREMMITWLRSVMVSKGVVVSASIYGKIKTTLQLAAIFLLSINLVDVGVILLWISIAVAYYSALDYFKLFINKKVWK